VRTPLTAEHTPWRCRGARSWGTAVGGAAVATRTWRTACPARSN